MSQFPTAAPREKIKQLGSQVMVKVVDPLTNVSRDMAVNVFESGAPAFPGGEAVAKVCNSIQEEFRVGIGQRGEKPISRPAAVEQDKEKAREVRTPSL